MDEWRGDNPYYLIIHHQQESDGVWVNSIVDLDEFGWSTTQAHLLRLPGSWFLVDKETRCITLAIKVEDGEQPYYTARHYGKGSVVEDLEMSIEIIAFGIGKKRKDGFVERLWHVKEAAMTCTGDDIHELVEPFLATKYELLRLQQAASKMKEKPTE